MAKKVDLFLKVSATSSALFYFVAYRGILEHNEVSKIQWTWEIGKVRRCEMKILFSYVNEIIWGVIIRLSLQLLSWLDMRSVCTASIASCLWW